MNDKNFWKYVVAGITLIGLCGIFGFVSIKKYERDAEISANTAIEQKKIEQEEATKRTRERMNLIPWYKGGENKKD